MQNGYNGFLFTPGDAHDLAEKIRALENISIKKLQENARQSVLSLDQDTYLQAILNLYSSLIQAKK